MLSLCKTNLKSNNNESPVPAIQAVAVIDTGLHDTNVLNKKETPVRDLERAKTASSFSHSFSPLLKQTSINETHYHTSLSNSNNINITTLSKDDFKNLILNQKTKKSLFPIFFDSKA
jgi:hypothetical protein